MIYFYEEENKEFLEELKSLATYYKEYFLLTLVDTKKKSKYTKKLINYLGV